MKKIFLYSGIIAATAAMTGCNEDYKDWANPLTNPQLDPTDKVESTIINMHSQTINSADYAGKDTIEFVKFTGATNTTVAQVTFKQLYIGSHTIPFSQGEEDVTVKPHQLDSVVALEYKSVKYTERDLQVKADIAVKDAQGTAYSTVSNVVTVKYMPQEVIPARHKLAESAYYYVGGKNGWDLSGGSLPMAKNEDGSFTITLEVGSDEYFAFAPQSAVSNGDWGMLLRAASDGCTDMSGFFNDNTSHAFRLEEGGVYKFTIWPEDYYYEIKESMEVFYAGDAYGWDKDMRPMSKKDGVFTGYYYINVPDYGSFKFVGNGSWYGGENGIIGGDKNITPADGEGFYKIVADWNQMTYELTKIEVVSLVGSAVNGDTSWGTDYDLAFNPETKAWEGEYPLTDGEMKLRAGHDWNINWGGALNAMTSDNGANIPVTAGKYKISFTPNCDGMGVLTMTPAN